MATRDGGDAERFAAAVKQANRTLYDAVAERYEELDGRRSPALAGWLEGTLRDLRRRAPGGTLLDLGAGSGFVCRCAEGVFSPRLGVDISPRILAAHRQAFDLGVACDVDRLPFADASLDVVTCFAVLHHLVGVERLVPELRRVLRPGGLFYSDHDMDEAFRRRFALPLHVYRRARDAGAKYLGAGGVTRETYRLAEVHEDGVDTPGIQRALSAAGFEVETRFHWFGLTPLTDRVFGRRFFRRGRAPLVSFLARRG